MIPIIGCFVFTYVVWESSNSLYERMEQTKIKARIPEEYTKDYLDNYKCDEGGVPKIKGDSAKIRCCKEDEDDSAEIENEDLNYEKLKY